jgi:hypothetical protein
MPFENVLNAGITVSGSATLQELPSAGLPFPSLVTVGPVAIQQDQVSQVVFNWTQGGPLLPWITANWRFDVFLEQMGPSEGPAILFTTTPYIGAAGAFTSTLVIPAGTVPVGVFRVTARMMLLQAGFTSDTSVSPVVAFEDLGLVQYHNA